MKLTEDRLPRVDFLGFSISKFILGSNPFSGFSHQNRKMDEEMMDFYTATRIKKTWDQAQQYGINAICGRGDRHMLLLLREYWNEGKGRGLFWFAQTAPEYASFEASVSLITNSRFKPSFIYHHGGQLDYLLMEGKKQLVKDHLKIIRDTGYPCGLASHQPQFIALAEEENWDVDFYLTCFFNLTGRGKQGLTALKGSAGEVFDRSDPPKMCEVIKQVKKPCVAYKIFGSGRLCQDRKQLYQAISFAVENIKPGDLILAGVFQKYGNQLKEDVEIVRRLLSRKQQARKRTDGQREKTAG
ncbi:MAG TPA: hypothetical protein PKX93_08835 [bacterium]|nr:hypothetical protein [bacterium]HPP11377.1 hypothetical protein [bacterium]